jgi:hypothetical protein
MSQPATTQVDQRALVAHGAGNVLVPDRSLDFPFCFCCERVLMKWTWPLSTAKFCATMSAQPLCAMGGPFGWSTDDGARRLWNACSRPPCGPRRSPGSACIPNRGSCAAPRCRRVRTLPFPRRPPVCSRPGSGAIGERMRQCQGSPMRQQPFRCRASWRATGRWTATGKGRQSQGQQWSFSSGLLLEWRH